ncbi:MAG: CDP-alcohol phosphatidyltransferase family protein [Aristaeellaceae bacterium]
MKFNKHQILTIPNLLSLLRLLMIPVFVWLYLNGYTQWTAFVLILSGITDVVDGFIARHFGQVSDFGKAFDPVADKLTQAAMLLCLVSRHPMMIVPFILLAVKEIFAAVSGLIVIRRTGAVLGAEWHGKLTTLLLYGMMILHVIWQDIPQWTSNMLNAGCVVMMLISLVLYARRNIRAIRSASGKDK